MKKQLIPSQPKTIALCAILVSLAASARAADPTSVMSHVDVVFDQEFANEYVTPRGMIVTDRGMTYQPLLLGLVNLYHGDTFFNDLTFVPGVWSDFCSSQLSKTGPTVNTAPTTQWIEIDPILGMSLSFAKHFKLDMTFTEFNMQVLDIPTSQHLDNKLSFDDSDYLKAFALHPYFEYWQELRSKATDADLPYELYKDGVFPAPRAGAKDADPNSSFYFELGIDPGYTFKEAYNLKVEMPCRVLLPDSRFYGDYFAPSSTVGVVEAGLKFSVPMNFMPAGYGHWSFHTGFKYLNFVDDNLYYLNEFNEPGKPTRDTFQFYAGLNTFF